MSDEYLVHSCADCPLASRWCYVGDNEQPFCNHPHANKKHIASENESYPEIIPDDCPLMMNGVLMLRTPTRMIKDLRVDNVSFVNDNGDPSLGRITERIGGESYITSDDEMKRRIEVITRRNVRIVLIKFELVFFTFLDAPDQLNLLRIENGDFKEIDPSIYKMLTEKFTWRVLDAATCAQIAHVIKTVEEQHLMSRDK